LKVVTEFGEIKIPKVIVDEWKKHKREYADIKEFIGEKASEFLSSYEGKLVDKELAIFLRDCELDSMPRGCGPPISEELSFEDAGNKYTILAFGWSDENGVPHIHMIGYKEP